MFLAASATKLGNFAISLIATDLDNDILTYSISGIDAGSFSILNGEVRFITPPDYETKTSYNFIATASDGVNEINQNITINIAQ